MATRAALWGRASQRHTEEEEGGARGCSLSPCERSSGCYFSLEALPWKVDRSLSSHVIEVRNDVQRRPAVAKEGELAKPGRPDGRGGTDDFGNGVLFGRKTVSRRTGGDEEEGRTGTAGGSEVDGLRNAFLFASSTS